MVAAREGLVRVGLVERVGERDGQPVWAQTAFSKACEERRDDPEVAAFLAVALTDGQLDEPDAIRRGQLLAKRFEVPWTGRPLGFLWMG